MHTTTAVAVSESVDGRSVSQVWFHVPRVFLNWDILTIQCMINIYITVLRLGTMLLERVIL